MKDFKDFSRSRSDKEILFRLFGYLKPHKKPFIIAIVLMALSLAVDLLPPLLLGYLIDLFSNGALEISDKIDALILVIIGYLVVLGLANIVSYYQQMLLQKVGQSIVNEVRYKVFNHIEHLSIGQINEVPVGKLVTRVNNDTNAINELYTSVFTNLLRNIIYIVAILVIILFIHFKIGILVWALMPIVILSTYLFRIFSRKAYRKVRNNVSDINAFLSENLSGIKITQAFNQEDKKT